MGDTLLVKDICAIEEVSYQHRVYNQETHNYCVVPDSAYDAILFAAIGIIFTCIAPKKHYAILMLIFGSVCQVCNMYLNTLEFGNAFTIWIGMQPAELFFYIFLPPLLLDSAVRIDFFVFKKVMPAVLTFAFLVVAANTVILAAFLMLGLSLRTKGWTWTDAFLFSCMIASTDAVAVSAIMKEGGGPEDLIVLIEGESLFNDATSIVFFDLFWPRFKAGLNGELPDETLGKIIGDMTLETFWLAIGGTIFGLVSGILTSYILKILQNRNGHSPIAEVGITVGMSYLSFYLANAVIGVSGVIAVVVYGLYGASSTQWDMSPKARESKVFEGFWDVTALLTNGVVFFYAGASATNFFLGTAKDLFEDDMFDGLVSIFAWLPIIYIAIFVFRFLELVLFAPLLLFTGSIIKLNEISFISGAGLRGALSLILAQTLLQYQFPSDSADIETKKIVRAQSALWTCGFVMLTLLINAPGIPWLLKICKLQNVSLIKQKSKEKANKALIQYTYSVIKHFKTDRFNMLRGVNWKRLQNFIIGPQDVNESMGDYKLFRRGSTTVPAVSQSSNALTMTKWNLITLLMPQPSKEVPIDLEEGSDDTDKILKEMDSQFQQAEFHNEDAPFAGSYTNATMLLETQPLNRKSGSLHEERKGSRKSISYGYVSGLCIITDDWVPNVESNAEDVRAKTQNKTVVGNNKIIIETQKVLPKEFKRYTSFSTLSPQDSAGRQFDKSTLFNLHRNDIVLPQIWKEHVRDDVWNMISVHGMPTERQRNFSMADEILSMPFLEYDDIDDSNIEDYEEQVLAEARFRMLAGLKKYFHGRRTQGFISGKGLRLLHWACDIGMEHSNSKLEVWDKIKEEISGKWQLKLQSMFRYHFRKAAIYIRNWPLVIRKPLLPILNFLAHLMSWNLTRDLQISLEVAIEYWLALLVYRSHSKWLLKPGRAGDLAEELKKQAEQVWKFIIDREIEAPERFEAIQTFRAMKAIIKQQMAYVDQLADVGLLDEQEHESMKDQLDEKLIKLARKGLSFSPGSILEFCRNIPFFTNASEDVYRRIIAKCHLYLFRHGEMISDRSVSVKGQSKSIHIVVNGMLKTSYTDRAGITYEYYVGKGGMFGLLWALTGTTMGRIDRAYAELNALGQGPSILTIPDSVLTDIKQRAAAGELEYQQIELDMLRLAALYVIEFMQNELVQTITGLFVDKALAKIHLESSTETENSTQKVQQAQISSNKFLEDMFRRHVRLVSLGFDETSIDSVLHEGNLDMNGEIEINGTDNIEMTYTHDLLSNYNDKAIKFLNSFKKTLLAGDLILLPGNKKFVLSSSFVLLKGSLRTFSDPINKKDKYDPVFNCQFSQRVKLTAPALCPWILSDPDVMPEGLFWAGEHGAVIVRCASSILSREELDSLARHAVSAQDKDSARISGYNLAPMLSAEISLVSVIRSNT